MVHMCKMIISPGIFFQFFKILIFWIGWGVKGQKAIQNDKKFCPLCSVSQESYILCLSFMVHPCKMIISPGICFHIFKILIVWAVKKAKDSPKWQKILSIVLHISGTIHHMTVIYGTHLQNDNIFSCVFHFFKFLIFWVHVGVKGQKMVQNYKKFCLSHSISQEPCIIWLSFMAQMCKMISPGVFFIFISKLLFLGSLGGRCVCLLGGGEW